jgi:hypothetical protein
MKYYEAPDIPVCQPDEVSVFMAGGITGTPDWQQELRAMLEDVEGLVLVNPRRAEFDVEDPTLAVTQIGWEFVSLRAADAILFWFPPQTLCPIVLYELGAWAGSDKPIVVGTHPNYARAFDVEIQVGLVRHGFVIDRSLADLAVSVRKMVQTLR